MASVVMRDHPRSRPALAAACASLILVALCLPGWAAAKIVVGQGIAAVKLGDTQAQVEKALGKPSKMASFSGGATTWYYPNSRLFLGVVSFDGHRRVHGMFTSAPGQKTSKGIGPGSPIARVRRAYPDAKCTGTPPGRPNAFYVCVLKSRYRGRKVETLISFIEPRVREIEVDFVS